MNGLLRDAVTGNMSTPGGAEPEQEAIEDGEYNFHSCLYRRSIY